MADVPGESGFVDTLTAQNRINALGGWGCMSDRFRVMPMTAAEIGALDE